MVRVAAKVDEPPALFPKNIPPPKVELSSMLPLNSLPALLSANRTVDAPSFITIKSSLKISGLLIPVRK